jgi:hypothetical protein
MKVKAGQVLQRPALATSRRRHPARLRDRRGVRGAKSRATRRASEHRHALEPLAARTAQGSHSTYRPGPGQRPGLSLRYAGTVEDEVYAALSHRFGDIFAVLGQLPDAFEDDWVDAVLKDRSAVQHFSAGRQDQAADGAALTPRRRRRTSARLGIHGKGAPLERHRRLDAQGVVKVGLPVQVIARSVQFPLWINVTFCRSSPNADRPGKFRRYSLTFV